ncbi:MAG: pyridoxamine 5'-phosphate oxidase, partial [Clostridiales bacterium]
LILCNYSMLLYLDRTQIRFHTKYLLTMLKDIRTDYQKFELAEQTVNKNPFLHLTRWLTEALEAQQPDPTAMVLSTIDKNGYPDARVVLLKEITSDGLIFFTNYESRKGQQIADNNHVSVVFLWSVMERQVRVKGTVEKIPDKDSEDYFLSRPLESQLGAWASPQSQVIENRQVLTDNYIHYKKEFETRKMIKPPHWGGFIIRPEYFEFWQGRSNRLHDRLSFSLMDQNWEIHRLAP